MPEQALPLILLYRQERRQYDLTIQKHPNKSPSEIYGAEHLLRAFGEGMLHSFSVLMSAVTVGEGPTVVVVVGVYMSAELKHLEAAPKTRQRASNMPWGGYAQRFVALRV